jgi:hypothetical protein
MPCKSCCHKKKLEIITQDICLDAKFCSDTVYVIIGEVRILPMVSLHVERNTQIYITNGIFTNSSNQPTKSKLIFETGSKLYGSTIYFKACGQNYLPENLADNGGLFFLGSSSKAEKDFVSVNFNINQSSFNAQLISLSYLGGKDAPVDPNQLSEGLDKLDDYDAISIVGVNNNEWSIKNVYSEFSGDDGFDVENSSIELDSVEVKLPTEDGLNITSSRVNILKKLSINMEITEVFDRDIFDLEIDDGPSFVRLEKDCVVKIDGIFGDQLTLVSGDLPQPDGDKPYVFDGKLLSGQTYIYSGQFAL